MTQRQVLDSRISDCTLQCQYLLLFLLNVDEEKTFTTDPCSTVSGYSSVVPRPMWLEKVRENLDGRYRLVGEFISDVRLIFKNCAIYNRNNLKYKELGMRLSDVFEKEFLCTFNIEERSRDNRMKGMMKKKEKDNTNTGVLQSTSNLPTLLPARAPHQSNSAQRSCEACTEVPDSSHWVLVDPEVSTEKRVSTCSLSSPAGRYECSESGLRWSCVGQVTLQYCFADWHLLAGELPNMQYRPAGPSMEIKLISGELEEIHLPHFLCLGGSQSCLKDAVKVLHKQDSGVCLEKFELSRFHARLVNPSFSLLGPFYSLMSLMRPGEEREHMNIHADVQVYRSSTSPLNFRLYLLPEDAHLRKLLMDEEEGFRGFRLPRPRPVRPLQMHEFYGFYTTPEPIRIYPVELDLRVSNIGPNFAEVRIGEAGDFKIKLISSADQQTVWEADITRSECFWTNPHQSSDNISAAEFLKRHQADLVQKVKNVMPLADKLLSQGHISADNYADIRTERTDQDKMRCVFKVLESCGDRGKRVFITNLQEQHSDLLEELGMPLGWEYENPV
ncbi:NACHT, LRR and PYD domains-containing protein 1 homolog [Clupea harengus]|uniref:NACHT, LRR and PYD domains-containing protein 1 homolog n=1 Tax=Clupea harengus TaxID=7950 RepID=A0A6P8EXY8_CLUHA|nr:NACHT, LRR and PYD domains-containing protein 1 homolog [Clupea harengus]